MRVDWDPLALEDWRRLPFDEASAVAVAIEAWAKTGAGVVVSVEIDEYMLFVGDLVVVFFLNHHTQTVTVWHVRHA